MTTAELERSVRGLVLEASERVELPDTNAIAEIVIADLSPEQLRKFAVRGVAEYVRCVGRSARRGGTPSSSGRWDDVKRANASGELDLARYSIWTGTQMKWLLDCTVPDLVDASESHEHTAESHRKSAEQLQKLAGILKRKTGANVVGDLPESKVRGVLDA